MKSLLQQCGCNLHFARTKEMNFKIKVMGKIYIYLYTLICTLLHKLFSHILAHVRSLLQVVDHK